MKKYILIIFILGITGLFSLSFVNAQKTQKTAIEGLGEVKLDLPYERIDLQKDIDKANQEIRELRDKDKNSGINSQGNCLTGMGKGCFEYGKILGISDYQKQNYSALSIAQDIIFAAMYMVGTILTIVIIYCGFMYIWAAREGKDTNSYRKGLVNGAIGALLVRGAYTIVRLIQYVAKG